MFPIHCEPASLNVPLNPMLALPSIMCKQDIIAIERTSTGEMRVGVEVT